MSIKLNINSILTILTGCSDIDLGYTLTWQWLKGVSLIPRRLQTAQADVYGEVEVVVDLFNGLNVNLAPAFFFFNFRDA